MTKKNGTLRVPLNRGFLRAWAEVARGSESDSIENPALESIANQLSKDRCQLNVSKGPCSRCMRHLVTTTRSSK